MVLFLRHRSSTNESCCIRTSFVVVLPLLSCSTKPATADHVTPLIPEQSLQMHDERKRQAQRALEALKRTNPQRLDHAERAARGRGGGPGGDNVGTTTPLTLSDVEAVSPTRGNKEGADTPPFSFDVVSAADGSDEGEDGSDGLGAGAGPCAFDTSPSPVFGCNMGWRRSIHAPASQPYPGPRWTTRCLGSDSAVGSTVMWRA